MITADLVLFALPTLRYFARIFIKLFCLVNCSGRTVDEESRRKIIYSFFSGRVTGTEKKKKKEIS